MPASTRSKISEAVALWMDSESPAQWDANSAWQAREVLAVALEAIGKGDVLRRPWPARETTLETLTAMCRELSLRLSTSTARFFEDTVSAVVAKWIGNDRQGPSGQPVSPSRPIEGCRRFTHTSNNDHVRRLIKTLVERDVDDFVYDVTELVLSVASEADSDGTDSEESNDSGIQSDEDEEGSGEEESGEEGSDDDDDGDEEGSDDDDGDEGEEGSDDGESTKRDREPPCEGSDEEELDAVRKRRK